MAITVTWANVNYTISEPGDAWTPGNTDFLKAITTAPFLRTTTALPALSGFLRLASSDSLAWRNFANSADISLSKDSNDNLTWKGAPLTGNPYLEVRAGTAATYPATAVTKFQFANIVTDTDAGWSAVNFNYTIPANKGGNYLIAASARITGVTAAAGTEFFFSVYKNTTEGSRLLDWYLDAAITTNNLGVFGVTALQAAAGDVLDLRLYNGGSTAAGSSTNPPITWMTILRISS
jgi:hypothetical protein